MVIGYIGLLHVLNEDLIIGFVAFFLAFTIAYFNLTSYISEATK
jgi:hypothetical protein